MQRQNITNIKLKKKKISKEASLEISHCTTREKFFPALPNKGSRRVDKSKVNRSSVVGTGRKLELPVAREINVRDTYTRPRCRCTMFRGIVTHS